MINVNCAFALFQPFFNDGLLFYTGGDKRHDFFQAGARNHNHTIPVAKDKIARFNPDTADDDRNTVSPGIGLFGTFDTGALTKNREA